MVSLLLAAALAVGLMFLPAMRGRDLTSAGHALLTPLLLTVCAGFVHGIGYEPRNAALRGTLRPIVLWPAMLGLGVAWILYS
ncbi:MAG TPA: cyd operon YbgE family protein [Xanthomonadaceae bacterium]|nr:cyd operon YbgE family protein [Xanthomonadaceae bacterium]